MCVIVFKPAGVSMPDKEILKHCWESNPDGAGIILREKGELRFQKGLMTKWELKAFLEFLSNRIDLQEIELAIHFRLGTSGGINLEMTHPMDLQDPRRLYGKSEALLMHNGIIPGLGTEFESDTMMLARKLAGKSEEEIVKILQCTPGRFLFATKTNTYLIGNFSEDGGVFYSNLSWKWKMERYNYLSFYSEDYYKYI